MPLPRILASHDDVVAGLAVIRADAQLPEAFDAAVLAEADEAARREPSSRYVDARELPLATIDPPGSRDLDQAFGIERRGKGYRVHYAIADVAFFVTPDGAIDAAARRRGTTVYLPDDRVPLHPPVLSEGAASLLPDEDRPALLWRIDLDDAGEPIHVGLMRSLVRSRLRLDYAEVQASLDAGDADEPLQLLREVGELRLARERARGGVSIPRPTQEVDSDDAGGLFLVHRSPLPVEDWNAQLSLLTGLCAAQLMLDGGVGLLRTMPPVESGAEKSLRRSASALGCPWPDTMSYGDWLRGLSWREPRGAALLSMAARMNRGAGYTAFDGERPATGSHSALAAPYAHVTAPLRRLADRYALEVSLALADGRQPPDWVRAALPQLPAVMAAAQRRDAAVDRAVVDLVEAVTLSRRVGERFAGSVVDVAGDRLTVQLVDPPVRAAAHGAAAAGDAVSLVLEEADPHSRTVRFRAEPVSA